MFLKFYLFRVEYLFLVKIIFFVIEYPFVGLSLVKAFGREL